MSSRPLPLAIIGLDGASFNLLDPLMADGIMPNLQALREEGWQADLMSTQPPATLPAWTSFLTASSPNVHGVCDMFVPVADTYRLQATGGSMRAVPTWVRQLDAAGLQVACLGVPGTFPPEPLSASSLCVSGFDAPGVRGVTAAGVQPRAFFRTLERLGGWRFATFNENIGGPKDDAVRRLLRDLHTKQRVIQHVLGMRRWDVFFVHLQASDTAAHHLWHTYDRSSPRHTRCSHALPKVFARLDQIIGMIHACMPHPCRIMVVSDHGMGGAGDVAVHLNRWLHQAGWLHYRTARRRSMMHLPGALLRTAAARLPVGAVGTTLRHLPAPWYGRLMAQARYNGVDHACTRAFSFELDYAPAIWLNRRSMFAQGCVDDDEAQALLRDLAEGLRAWHCPLTHTRMFDAVLVRDAGHPWPRRVPDVQLVPAWPGGYRHSFLAEAGPGPAVRSLSPETFDAAKGCGMPGVHRPAGIFIAHGPGMHPARLSPLNIADAGALTYALAGVSTPTCSDADHARIARMMHEMGGRSIACAHAPASPDASDAGPYTREQNNALLGRLADMGYI